MASIEIKADVIKPVECFKEAWQLIKGDYVLLFIVAIIGVAVGNLTLYILTGALICGIMKCYLQVIDGEKAEFEWLFKNIKQNFLAGLFVTVVIVLPMILVFALITIPAFLPLISGNPLNDDDFFALMTGAFLVEFVIAFIMVCLHTLLIFAFPLIADKNLSGWEAIKLSAKAVWLNKNGVAGLWAIGFLISLVGLLFFCVGIYLMIPLLIAGNTVAYRKIFPKKVSL